MEREARLITQAEAAGIRLYSLNNYRIQKRTDSPHSYSVSAVYPKRRFKKASTF